jgi:uncharacterized membrane protein
VLLALRSVACSASSAFSVDTHPMKSTEWLCGVACECPITERNARRPKRTSIGSAKNLNVQMTHPANEAKHVPSRPKGDDSIPSTSRIEAFSDGVIAIALTILVLELKVPEIGAALNEQDILHILHGLLPKLAAYLLSFLIIAIYWVNHHHLFHLLERSNSGLLWCNNNLLLWLSLLSFPTALVGEHPTSQIAAALYGGVSFMTAVAFLVLHRYSYRHGLFASSYSHAAYKADVKTNVITLGFYALAICLAFVSPYLAEAGYLLIALLYFVPRIRAR